MFVIKWRKKDIQILDSKYPHLTTVRMINMQLLLWHGARLMKIPFVMWAEVDAVAKFFEITNYEYTRI